MSATTHHIAPIRLYLTIFAALIVGTILTVLVARYDFGPFNNIVMLSVAIAKATLVVLYFMHVRWSSRLTMVIAASGFFWMLIMFAFTMMDYMTRGWLPGTLR